MFNRRQLRIKVLQALYAYFQSKSTDLAIAEKELLRSIDKVYELYLMMLLLVHDVFDADRVDAEDAHLRHIKITASKHRLFNSKLQMALQSNSSFKDYVKKLKLSWGNESELVRKFFLDIKKSDQYKDYLSSDGSDENKSIPHILNKYVFSSNQLMHYAEENNIYWGDDLDFALFMTQKAITSFYETGALTLHEIYKDEEDDKKFVKDLFAKTIIHDREYQEAVSAKTKNWDVDRIALMDIIIIKMAISEMVNFQSIPVKVSINEYIDISKEFSTPKSKQFVNGVIDKIAIEWKANGKIVKTGRGLKE